VLGKVLRITIGGQCRYGY